MRISRKALGSVAFMGFATLFISGQPNDQTIPNLYRFENPAGKSATYSSNGAIDLQNPFFQSLGTNGRSCATCHLPDQGWSFSADKVQARFAATGGLDPIFRTNDGSVCDHDVDTSSVQGRSRAYSLLTSRGLIRVSINVPSDAEFEVANVKNPYGCNETASLSLYRRPLPSTNLRALSAVMWDGRESTPPSTEKITYVTNPNDLLFDLRHQAMDATLGHAQALNPPTLEQENQIVDFEMALSTAQISDNAAGDLNTQSGKGGPPRLSQQDFFVGINDPLGGNPRGIPFTPVAFTLFQAWSSNASSAKASIARGEAIFNSRTIHITGVAGLNDDLGVADIAGTCTTCHDSPNFGNHSLPVPLNIGVADTDSFMDLSYLPVITLRNKTTHQTVRTTDPGRALITGKWKDVGKVKGPILRGLAGRAPYFHNGSAATLNDIVDFYDVRFNLGLSQQEKADLVAFLNSV